MLGKIIQRACGMGLSQTTSLISLSTTITDYELRGRNSHVPKKANHGAMPCSSFMRRLRKRALYSTPKKDHF